jgi:hypothetical protein
VWLQLRPARSGRASRISLTDASCVSSLRLFLAYLRAHATRSQWRFDVMRARPDEVANNEGEFVRTLTAQRLESVLNEFPGQEWQSGFYGFRLPTNGSSASNATVTTRTH